MSRAKLSVLVIGVIAVAGVVVAGANILGSSSTGKTAASSMECESAMTAKTASGCPASSCTRTAQASSCPAGASAKTAGTAGECPALKGSSASGKGCPAASSASCSTPCGPKAAKTASIEEIGKSEGSRIVLVGHYACARCELGVSEGCQPAFQTKDGKNYLLVKNNLSDELRTAARDKDVEVVTRVKKLDGTKYLEVEVVRQAS
jgi:hypothetical protein